MNKLELHIDWYQPDAKDLKEYLKTVSGISSISIDIDKGLVSLKYDPSIIPIFMIKREIDLFLKDLKTPNLLSFNKYNEHDKEETLTIEKLCCEYCIKGVIEDLFENDGIISATSNFNYIDFNNVKIFIKYNSKLLKTEDLKLIEKEINK